MKKVEDINIGDLITSNTGYSALIVKIDNDSGQIDIAWNRDADGRKETRISLVDAEILFKYKKWNLLKKKD
jgi:hypothetical protein